MPVNILIASSRQHLPYCSVMLESLYRNNEGEHFHVYVILDGSEHADLEPLRTQAAKWGHRIFPLPVDVKRFCDFPTLFNQWPKFLYYKILAADLLPPDADRVLLLESDMIVTKSVRPLYDTEFGENHLAACTLLAQYWKNGWEKELRIRRLRRLGILQEDGFFCGGVALLNLKKIREDGIGYDTMVRFAERLHYCWGAPEEHLMNAMFHDTRKAMDPFSYCLFPMYWQADERPIEGSEGAYGTILHYAASRKKPWDGYVLGVESEWDRIWWKYAEQTPTGPAMKARFLERLNSGMDYQDDAKTISNLDLHQRTLVRWNYLLYEKGPGFLEDALFERGIRRVAVYGVNLFQALIDVALKDSAKVTVAYFADTYVSQPKGDWITRKADDCAFDDVDAVIISAISHREAIKQRLSQVPCPVIALNDLILELLPESYDQYTAIFRI